MSKTFKIASGGLDAFTKKVTAIKEQAENKIQQVVVETTLLAQEAIVEKITNDIDPHSGLSRKNNPQEVVTDLVDTGFYRGSWLPSFPGPFKGQIATNVVYALKLEYGDPDTGQKPFFVARDTSVKMGKVFRQKVKQALKDLTQ